MKWGGEVSESIRVQLGVRQGGILSTHFYKCYSNNMLLDLESQSLGKYIGTVYTGCSTCADEVLLMSGDPVELQTMLNLASSYTQEHRYNIHPLKSSVVRRVTSRAWQQKEGISAWHWLINSQTTHLGLISTSQNESAVYIEE